MKKGFLIILLGFISQNSFSQDSNKKEGKRNQFKWGVSLFLNNAHNQLGFTNSAVLDNAGGPMINNIGTFKRDKSFSIGGLLKYSLNEYYMLRCRFVVTNINIKSGSDFIQLNKFSSNESTFKQNSIESNFGIQRGFRKDFFELYGGLMVSYSNFRKINLLISHYEKSISTDSITFWNTREFDVPGGYLLGFGGFLGISFYLNRYFSLGTEISWSYCYVNMGGIMDDIQIFQYPPDGIQTNSQSYEESYRGFRFTKLNPSIIANIYF